MSDRCICRPLTWNVAPRAPRCVLSGIRSTELRREQEHDFRVSTLDFHTESLPQVVCMSLLSKAQQAARVYISAGQQSSPHVRKFYDQNVRNIVLYIP